MQPSATFDNGRETYWSSDPANGPGNAALVVVLVVAAIAWRRRRRAAPAVPLPTTSPEPAVGTGSAAVPADVHESGYRLAVDYGTSNTVAVLRWPDGRTRPLLFGSSPLLPSAVQNADGRLLTGQDARNAARADPASHEPNPKRRIDDGRDPARRRGQGRPAHPRPSRGAARRRRLLRVGPRPLHRPGT
ncbi:hypothetical protein AB0J72_34005 [Dactylosporangium sp. NPDC049742]|uniref:hypothetical protein n=1 Tax=Dactylosporangium sp. NPDC049742 TaxID=3154737 RepID=UPI003412AC7F